MLRVGTGKGIQAIVVYPMNALANSQVNELHKFLGLGYPDGRGPVTFARYTGQEKSEERERILSRPPDILLTNYVMLELILTRPRDQQLVQAAQGLQFLVFDELHTYRGRPGSRCRDADPASARRDVCPPDSVRWHFGDTQHRRRCRRPAAKIAEVARQLFGTEVRPEHVIGETLRRVTASLTFDSAEGRTASPTSAGRRPKRAQQLR